MDQATSTRMLLFVRGNASAAIGAISWLRRFCDAQPPGCYELEVVDIFQQPEVAKRYRILATPTFLRLGPGLQRRVVGEMTEARLLECLGLP